MRSISRMPCIAAVLAEPAVQRVEGDVRTQRGERLADLPVDVDPSDAVALMLERLGAGGAGTQGHLALGR